MSSSSAEGHAPKTVSVISVAYLSDVYIGRCVDSVLAAAAAGEPVREILIVNNGPASAVLSELSERPLVTVIDAGGNLGFGAACNLGAKHAQGDILFFLNPDTELGSGAIPVLIETLDDPEIAIATARIRLRSDPELLNAAGGTIHITGLGWVNAYRQSAARLTENADVTMASGAAMAMRAETFDRLGGFWQELFLYHEDADLSWRAWLAGQRVVVVARADVVHDYEFSRHQRKLELVDRNRLLLVLTGYPRRMLALLAPVLIGAEIVAVITAAQQGWVRGKLNGWRWCWQHRQFIRDRRRQVQATRRVTTAALAQRLSPTITGSPQPVPAFVMILNRLAAWYWRAAIRLMRRGNDHVN